VRRALAPVAVWMTDERLGGLAVHVANDGPDRLRAGVRVAIYAGERRLDEAGQELDLPAHGSWESDVDAILGRFADASWAYRFGPSAHDAVLVSLERDGVLLSQAARFPAGRPLEPRTAEELGLEIARRGDGVVVRSRGLAYGVRIHAPGRVPADDSFHVEPGGERAVALRPSGGAAAGDPWVTALNLRGTVHVDAEGPAA
jgi:beta-mannosidase